MAKLDVLKLNGEKASTVELNDAIWNIEVNVYWPETINGRRVVRSASVISARTGNR